MSAIARRYPRDDLAARLYRRVRLCCGGLQRLAAHFPVRGRIVDLGCGMGLLAHLLVEGHPERRVFAIDHDPKRVVMLVQSARGLPIDVGFADLATACIPPCAGVALVDVLHYLGGAAQEAVLARAAAALEPGGVLVLRDPDPSAPLRCGLARMHEAIAIHTGWTKAREGRYRSAETWSHLLRTFGLAPEVQPLPWWSPYADRTVVGRKA